MPSATREIRTRIRSITSTRKVTKAMELVASAKMRRAVQAVLATRPYSVRAWELLLNLSRRTAEEAHPLLKRGKSGRIGLVLIASNRGLVGGFNTQLVAAAVQYLSLHGIEKQSAEIVLLGKRGRSMVVKHGYAAAAEFEKLDVVTNVEEVRPVARLATDDFIAGKYDHIILAYTDYRSTLIQKPRVRQLLPLEQDTELGAVGAGTSREGQVMSMQEYLFEPDTGAVLDALLPRLVEMQLYQAVLESNASEHAARMMAMRNASDAADDLIDDLTLSYNQARQAGITQDLAEISASRSALGS